MSNMMLDWAIRGLLILAVAGGAALLLRRASAAVRHLVWTLGLAGVLAVPALRPIVPGVALPVPGWTSPAGAAAGAATEPPASRATASLAVTPSPSPSVSPGTVPGSRPDPAGASPGSYRLTQAPAETTVGHPERPAARGGKGVAAGDEATGNEAVDRGFAGGSTAGWLLAFWLLGALACLLPTVAGRIGLARLARRSRDLGDPGVRRTAARLELRLGLQRRYRLIEGPAGSMPMTFGVLRPAIVLPADARDWAGGRLDAVLLHELAHVARRDTTTQLLAEVVRAVHWFNPMTWLAARRLRIEREHACDDMALAAGSRPSDYAGELLGLARAYRVSGVAAAAALAMARRGDVPDRLKAVLDGNRRRGRVSLGRALFGATAAALAVALCAAAVPSSAEAADDAAAPGRVMDPPVASPGEGDLTTVPSASDEVVAVLQQAVETCLASGDSWNSIQNQSRDGRRTIRLQRSGCDFELRMEGDMTFDAYEMRIRSMSPGARLRIEEDARSVDHSLDVRADGNGDLTFAYRRDGRDHPFDAGAQAWFQAAIQELFRSTGFLADERVEALLRQGGVEAVFAELGQLESSHVFAAYTQALLKQAELDEAELRALVRSATARVDSDHYLAGILAAVAEHQPLIGGLLDDYLQATTKLDSDHYRTASLRAAIDSGRLTGDQIEAVLRAAGSMDSDHYRTEVLVGVADRYAMEPTFRRAYLDATASMDSDHYRTEVLGRLLGRADLDPGEKAEVLRSAAMIESDHYKSTLLAQVAETGLTEPALHRAYFEVAADLDSDHYYRQSMGILLDQGVDDALLVDIIESAARQIDSDHYLADLLVAVVDGYTVEGAVRDAFLTAMDSLDSSHYRGQVADALLRQGR